MSDLFNVAGERSIKNGCRFGLHSVKPVLDHLRTSREWFKIIFAVPGREARVGNPREREQAVTPPIAILGDTLIAMAQVARACWTCLSTTTIFLHRLVHLSPHMAPLLLFSPTHFMQPPLAHNERWGGVSMDHRPNARLSLIPTSQPPRPDDGQRADWCPRSSRQQTPSHTTCSYHG